MATGTEPPGPTGAESSEPPLESILEEIEAVVEPVTESVAMSPAVGIAVAGGPMIALPAEEPVAPVAGSPAETSTESVRTGLTQAGPVAVAGLVVNGVAALLVVAVARLVSPRSYGEIAQLLGLFFILSMPGSAVLVGVVRRVTALEASGQAKRVHRWMTRVYRATLAALGVEVVAVLVTRGWIARQLSLHDSRGVALILVAGGIWILLSVDRGLLQARRRYRSLAVNLLVEGSARTVLVLVFVGAHLGVAGYALGVFCGEGVAALHAHWLNSRDRSPRAVATTQPADLSVLARRRLVADVGAAFCGLALLGFLQNVDVIVLGRLDHANVGAYAAISVASKAMVFGALALGAYLLPEATIRWNEGGDAVRQFGVTLIFLAVPAVLLLAVSVLVPKQFLTIVFGARLSGGAPAFAALVGAMICLSVSVLVTNYLFGTGSRWIVLLLAAGSGAAAALVSRADGQILATARADLLVQVLLVTALLLAFVVVHARHRGERWLPAPLRGRRLRPEAATKLASTLGVRFGRATER